MQRLGEMLCKAGHGSSKLHHLIQESEQFHPHLHGIFVVDRSCC
jgi:hypothetical protein